MATKQNDEVAMTQKQLAGVSGGPHIRNYGVTAPIQQRRSNRSANTGRVVAISTNDNGHTGGGAIWTAGGTTGIWSDGTFTS